MKSAWKVVVLGEARVGKTSLIHRVCLGEFDEHQKKTVDAKSFIKEFNLVPTGTIKLSIWDTAGQEKYHALNKSYYQNSLGSVIVFDITDTVSYDKMQQWVKELAIVCPEIPIVIAGNKSDLADNRQVEAEKCEE